MGYSIIISKPGTPLYTLKEEGSGRVLVFPTSQALKHRKELKAKGFEVQLIPVT